MYKYVHMYIVVLVCSSYIDKIMHTSETNNVIKLLTPRQHIVIQHMLFSYYVIQGFLFFSWIQAIFKEIYALFSSFKPEYED